MANAAEQKSITIPVEEYAELRETIAQLKEQNKELADRLTVLLNRSFGRKSERMDPAQLQLFANELIEASRESEPAEDRKPAKKAKKGHGRAPFPPHLHREEIELDVVEEDRVCPDCGKPMKMIGEDVCERGHIIPARMLVKRYVCKKYGCPDGHAVRTAPLPPSVIDKGKYEASVYSHLAVAKYSDHQPLHRLEAIYKRSGFTLPKSTMWDMLRRTDELVAQPILKQMREELLQEEILQADETPTKVMLEDRKGSKDAWIWCYGFKEKVIFDFTMSRGRDGPCAFLGDWVGLLQSDGYSGYDEVVRRNDLERAGCWAHARRKVNDALETGATQAVGLMRQIQRLFWIERAVDRRAEARRLEEEAKAELRRQVRETRSRQALASIRILAESLREDPRTLPKSALGKAVGYIHNQWESLARFLDHPCLPIHNNDAERRLRHVVVGRKNWLFFGSPRGAEVGAHLFSLISSCKAMGINPELYIEDVLGKIDTTPASEVASLTPWAWAENQHAAILA